MLSERNNVYVFPPLRKLVETEPVSRFLLENSTPQEDGTEVLNFKASLACHVAGGVIGLALSLGVGLIAYPILKKR